MAYNENLTDAQHFGPAPLVTGVAAFTGAGAAIVTVAKLNQGRVRAERV